MLYQDLHRTLLYFKARKENDALKWSYCRCTLNHGILIPLLLCEVYHP